jgi:hypothetical protein
MHSGRVFISSSNPQDARPYTPNNFQLLLKRREAHYQIDTYNPQHSCLYVQMNPADEEEKLNAVGECFKMNS